jgi:protein-S-isoprenylcysteine O-methyltransferase Ste14
LIYVSRNSIRLPLTHGLPRFIAWQAILTLFLLNMQSWFRNPFSVFQIISWICLIISIVLIVYGVSMLRKIGKPDASRDEEALLGIEKTTSLVTSGIYAYIRHPFYSSLLFLGLGIFFKDIAWISSIVMAVVLICLVLTAAIEEGEDIKFFGPAYREYMKKTKRFIPLIY